MQNQKGWSLLLLLEDKKVFIYVSASGGTQHVRLECHSLRKTDFDTTVNLK